MTLELCREGKVGWLIFDRPYAGNAIDARMFIDLRPRGPSSQPTTLCRSS